MCKATELLNEVQGVLSRIESEIDRLSKMMSKYDKELSKLYHEIENSKANAVEGFYYYKRIQTTLRKRRLVKNEHNRMVTLRGSMKLGTVKNNLNKAKKHVEHTSMGHKEYTDGWEVKFKDIEEEFSMQLQGGN